MAKRKQAKFDYDVARLPATRRQVLRDIYKNRLPLLLDLGLMLMLFFLPIAAVNLLVLAQSLDPALGELSAADTAGRLIELRNAGNILLIPALAILALGLAGAANIIKNLVWQEGVLFKGDFKKGIKSNGRCYCLTAVIAGILNYAAGYLVSVGFFESGTALQWSLIAIFAASFLFALALPFILIQSTLYNLGYIPKLTNGLLLSMRTFLPTLGILLLNVLPFLTLLIDNYTVYIFAHLLLPILVIPTLLLIDTLYVHSVLDKYVNGANFPEIYRKGLQSDADC